MSETHRRYVVVGGGIAGVTCAQELRRLDPAHQIVLVSADSTLKVRTCEMGLAFHAFHGLQDLWEGFLAWLESGRQHGEADLEDGSGTRRWVSATRI